MEVTTSYLQGKYAEEIRIVSFNTDNSHSWVRISHGLNKLVTDLSNNREDDNEQETSTTKTEVFAFAKRSKAKVKPRRSSTTCSYSRTFPMCERSLNKYGLTLNQELNLIKRTQGKKNKHSFPTRRIARRRWRSNSGDWKMIFRTNLQYSQYLMMYGRARWQEAEATTQDFNTVLTRQDKKFFTFELFKVSQDAIPLILHCRTVYWFRLISSSTFVISDVQSVNTPSQIQEWYKKNKIWAKDRRYPS